MSFFTELGIPFPEANAFFVSRLEFWGGLLLVAGFATRLVADALASTMVVALVTADRASLLEALGALSLDALLVRWVSRPERRAEARPAEQPA